MSDTSHPQESGSSLDHRSPVEVLAEGYLERLRNGETPTVEEYAEAHPELADEIRAVFPTLALLENFAPPDPLTAQPTAIAPNSAPKQLGDYRIASGEPMPRIMLVVDEFQELFVRDDRLAGDCTMLLDRLVPSVQLHNLQRP